MAGGSAIQTGNYQQLALITGKDTAKVKGRYTAKWKWINGEGWRIKRMETTPLLNKWSDHFRF
jgi:hypothetical protein